MRSRRDINLTITALTTAIRHNVDASRVEPNRIIAAALWREAVNMRVLKMKLLKVLAK